MTRCTANDCTGQQAARGYCVVHLAQVIDNLRAELAEARDKLNEATTVMACAGDCGKSWRPRDMALIGERYWCAQCLAGQRNSLVVAIKRCRHRYGTNTGLDEALRAVGEEP